MLPKDVNCQALSIDTSVFKQYNWLFKRNLLHRLEQFRSAETELIIPKIIVNEMRKHFKVHFEDRKREVETSNKTLDQFFSTFDKKKIEYTQNYLAKDDLADELFDSFIEDIGAEILDCSAVNCSILSDMYAESKPPFDESGPKKDEFPDAIALLALVDWAKRNDKKVLVVSNDKGWQAYGKESEYIEVVDDLSLAIEYFQPKEILDRIKDYFENRAIQKYALTDRICEAITEEISGKFVYPEADSAFFYEVESSWIEVDGCEIYKSAEDKIEAKVIEIKDTSVIIEVDAKISLTLHASFSLYVFDSIDRDNVPMGKSTVGKQFEEIVSVLITFEGDLTRNLDNLIVEDVEVPSFIDEVNVGEIEPDWYDYEQDA